MSAPAITAVVALFVAVAAGTAGPTAENWIETQVPSPTQPMPRPLPAPGPRPALPAALTPAEITVVGCLYREADVAIARSGRSEEAEGKGFVLAMTTLGSSGSAPASGTMYKVDKLADSQLSPHVGKRVELIGQIEADADDLHVSPSGAATTGRQSDAADAKLPEFDAVSIREVAGSCPARPTTR
jgi:hypothetical protein